MLAEQRISKLGSDFEGRLSQDLLSSALDYVTHGEIGLSLEILCDYLCEADVPITQQEYEEILSLGAEFHLDLNAGRFNYLKTLIQ